MDNDSVRLQKLNRLVEVSLVLNSTLELVPLLRVIMDTAAELSDASSASILLMDRATRQLHFMAFNTDEPDYTQHLMRVPVPLNDSIAGACVRENRIIVVDDVRESPLHYRDADTQSGYKTDSLIAVPMRLRDRVIGVLESVNKKAGRWTEDDTYFLNILASQAAVAIENSSLIERLRETYQDLAQLDKMKDDFIAIASHELRTPLGVILGYASFLKDESQGEASQHASAVLNSAMQMRQIVEDMTQLRYLRVGTSELNRQPLTLASVIQTTLDDMQHIADASGHHLRVVMPPSDLMILADSEKATMVLKNVLDNAIKFSEVGSRVYLDYELHDDQVWLTVEDQGLGLARNQFERIFDAFYQVEDHMTRRQNGMGLGLAIARAIMKAHDGSIWVKSNGLDQGSTFYISWPRHVAEE